MTTYETQKIKMELLSASLDRKEIHVDNQFSEQFYLIFFIVLGQQNSKAHFGLDSIKTYFKNLNY